MALLDLLASVVHEALLLILLALPLHVRICGRGAKGDDIRQASSDLRGFLAVSEGFCQALALQVLVAALHQCGRKPGDESLAATVAGEAVLEDEVVRLIQAVVGQRDFGLSNAKNQHDSPLHRRTIGDAATARVTQRQRAAIQWPGNGGGEKPFQVADHSLSPIRGRIH
jgi:hypothetical protein